MRLELEDILLRVSKSPVIDAGNLAEAEKNILESVMQGLQVQRASFWLLEQNGTRMRCKLLIDQRTGEPQAGLVLKSEDYPAYFQALLSERNIVASSVQTNQATAEFADNYAEVLGIDAMLDTPIRYKGNMIGVLCCEHCGGKRPWQVDEITFTGAMADIYGRAMVAAERTDYEEKLRDQNERLEEIVAERTRSLKEALSNFEQAQKRLVETEKMAALGKLVAGVAHEVNTPLGIAVTAITHCEHRLDKLNASYSEGNLSRRAMNQYLEETRQAYDLLASNLDRAALLVQNFKKTAVDQSSYELVHCGIADYLQALMYSLRPLLKKCNAQVTIDCDIELKVRTYQGAIAQIITNLVGNAAEHAFTDTSPDNQILITGEPTPTGVVLKFSDNGRGMDAQTKKHIFDPFYTTTRHNGGSGLGLSIVYNLVTQKLNGRLDVHSALGNGTEFVLDLPNIDV